MTELDEAVAELVDVEIIRHIGGTAGVHSTVLDPRLDRLEAAIRSSTSGRAGGGSASERSPLNSDALYLAHLIGSEIRSWCTMVRLPAGRLSMADSLRAWHEAKPDAGDFYLGKLNQWRHDIDTMLNPQGRFEYAVPCVACHATTWADEDGNEHPWPLLTIYPKDDIGRARVLCRACGLQWDGDGIGELIEEVEERVSQPT